jgi:hypothetical protein
MHNAVFDGEARGDLVHRAGGCLGGVVRSRAVIDKRVQNVLDAMSRRRPDVGAFITLWHNDWHGGRWTFSITLIPMDRSWKN